ncbi:hypothetical protein GW17_00003375 [Ensete ventricosum]|nr:hypothetical protein GW17_00003375 [Ensete ventricosum]
MRPYVQKPVFMDRKLQEVKETTEKSSLAREKERFLGFFGETDSLARELRSSRYMCRRQGRYMIGIACSTDSCRHHRRLRRPFMAEILFAWHLDLRLGLASFKLSPHPPTPLLPLNRLLSGPPSLPLPRSKTVTKALSRSFSEILSVAECSDGSTIFRFGDATEVKLDQVAASGNCVLEKDVENPGNAAAKDPTENDSCEMSQETPKRSDLEMKGLEQLQSVDRKDARKLERSPSGWPRMCIPGCSCSDMHLEMLLPREVLHESLVGVGDTRCGASDDQVSDV